ncbi:MAG: hypothetical protein O7H40_03550 [Gammaproteobacteria bacterium]|nr:hypothetical protein [Gammaproteobacteria bacterium]
MCSIGKILTFCALVGAAAMVSMPATAQVMARGYYHHLESRASFYISEVTEAEQVTTEMITYHVQGNEPMDVPAWEHSFASSRGVQQRVTVVDFAPYYEPHDSVVQYSMMYAATNYRQKGEVILDQGTRSDRIPTHLLSVRLPNGNILFCVFMLHQNDDMNERRLIIAEAEMPPGARQPALFLASQGIINPEFFGTDADHTLWRVRYTPAGPPIHGQELVATQPWGIGVFGEVMSAGGEVVPE